MAWWLCHPGAAGMGEEGERGSHVLLAIAGTIAAARRFPVSSEQTLPSLLSFSPVLFLLLACFSGRVYLQRQVRKLHFNSRLQKSWGKNGDSLLQGIRRPPGTTVPGSVSLKTAE